MNTAPGLLAAACALWAMQTGRWLIAAVAAAALEAPRLAALRWNVAQAHFNRLSDACSALIVAVGGYCYFTFGNPRALLLLIQWLPLLLLPLALAQAWGNRREVDIAAFVWTLRRSGGAERFALNLGYPYLAAWVLAAAAAPAREPAFFAGLTVLAGWALWATRPRRYPLVAWIALLAAAVGAGYGIHNGLHRLQAWIEDVVPEWVAASGARTDPYRSRTDLGHIGELKQDDAILLRVRPEGGLTAPLLLHRASYNSYFGRTWSARGAPLVAGQPAAGGRWLFGRDPGSAARVTVFDHSPRGDPVLSLPGGTLELRGLDAVTLKANGLGTVQAEMPAGYFSYVAVAGSVPTIESAPDDEDLRIAAGEQQLLGGIADGLGLAGLAAQGAVEAVRRYFADGFGYSLYQAGEAGSRSTLADFLLRTRAGHCEYFATATVLLLRAGGVPARYATGFSVQEFSRLENAYIARARHAHSWARAYVSGRWVDVDTTPSTWRAIEDQGAAWWSPVADLWSWLRFRLARFGAGALGGERMAVIGAAIAVLLAAGFGWLLYRRRGLMIFGGRAKGADGPARPLQGADSELFLIERALANCGLGRAAGETALDWLARIRGVLPDGVDADALAQVLRLHYRCRFDPDGLPPPERVDLRTLALRWLERWPQSHTISR